MELEATCGRQMELQYFGRRVHDTQRSNERKPLSHQRSSWPLRAKDSFEIYSQ